LRKNQSTCFVVVAARQPDTLPASLWGDFRRAFAQDRSPEADGEFWAFANSDYGLMGRVKLKL
jgi:hypothetical protein